MSTDTPTPAYSMDDMIDVVLERDAAHARVAELKRERAAAYKLLARIAYPARRTPDETATIQDFANEIQTAYTLDQLTEID